MTTQQQYTQAATSYRTFVMDQIRDCLDSDQTLPTIEGDEAINAIAVMALGQVLLNKQVVESIEYAVRAYAEGQV